MAPGSGNWGPGFRQMKGPEQPPQPPPLLQRGGDAGGQVRCESLKPKQGPAASWGAVAVCAPVS